MKYKILHFAPGFDHGGIESRLIDWFREIDRREFQFDILKTTLTKENVLIKEFEQLGGNVYTIPKFTPKNYKIFKNKIESIITENNYDAIHCHSPTTGNFVLDVAKKNNIKVRIMHVRTNNFDKSSRALIYRKYLKYRTVKKANKYLSCSLSAGNWMFGNDSDFEILKNGIDTNNFKYNSQIREIKRKEMGIKNAIVIGNVSRFSASKNHKLLLDITKQLKEKGKDIKLLLIGDGPEKNNILKEAKILNIEKDIIFMGNIQNVSDYYQAMDIFVFPSEYEGFGTVAIEAQVAGLKTIVSDGVPTDVDLTDLVKRVSLQSDLERWTDIICNNLDYERYDRVKEVKKAGYDVKAVVKRLEEIYRA